MKIYSIIKIGDYHINHCEDALFIDEICNRKIVCAVMDGCTMGEESYFASTIVKKILKKIVKGINFKSLYDKIIISNENYIKEILQELFVELKTVKNQLLLEQNELLTTLILLIADKVDNNGIVIVIGDGVIYLNGVITEYDQKDKPDYISYHLNENFNDWYIKQKQKQVFNNIEDLSIATDGILMIKQIQSKIENEKINPIDYLIFDKSKSETNNMLEIKLKDLDEKFGFKPTDDLALIRIINAKNEIAKITLQPENYNLFLDDKRDLHQTFQMTLDNDYKNKKWYIVRSYNEFCEFVSKNYFEKKTVPIMVSFDHDLADEHYSFQSEPIPYSKFIEKTGYDCAKWLINFCIQNGIEIPKYKIHTMNFIGEKNIINEFDNCAKIVIDNK